MTKQNDEYYTKNYPDVDPEDLAVIKSMDASIVVCTLTCVCGRIHEVEYAPAGSDWYESGVWCACGRKVTYGE